MHSFISFFQVSSLIGSTFVIQWPTWFSDLQRIYSVINIDVSMLRRPINAMMSYLGHAIEFASCNANDLVRATAWEASLRQQRNHAVINAVIPHPL